MTVEIAYIPVFEADREAFERAAVTAMEEVFPQSPGFIRGEVRKGVERIGHYVLLLEWERIEDHTETFVNSALFTRWVELAGEFISGDPTVEHWEAVSRS